MNAVKIQENNRIEFKSKLNDKLEREVVAFLNYHEGGVIYIGVDDSGNAVGVPDIDDTQLRISNRIRDNIQPATLGLYDVVVEQWQGTDVIKIIISSGSEKPYYLRSKGMSESGYFLRTGSGIQPMPEDMIKELFSKRTRNSLSKIVSPRNDLTFEQLKIYYEERNLKLNSQFKQSLELLTNEGNLNYVAYLLADENATSIKVAKYAGTNKIELIENEEYGYCSLIKAAKSVLNKFEIENITKTKITSKERMDRKLVDSVALREAVINAIVHNDYSSEVPPLFEIFSDRIVITSYGGLIEGLSEEEFFGCCSKPRNRELMRVFKDVGLVEQLGSGMERILAAYDKSIFEFSKNFMKVTFKYDKKAAIKSGDKKAAIKSGDKRSSKKYEEQRAAVIAYIAENKSVKSEELIDVLGVKISRVKVILSRMVDEKIIVAEGGNRNRVYKMYEQ